MASKNQMCEVPSDNMIHCRQNVSHQIKISNKSLKITQFLILKFPLFYFILIHFFLFWNFFHFHRLNFRKRNTSPFIEKQKTRVKRKSIIIANPNFHVLTIYDEQDLRVKKLPNKRDLFFALFSIKRSGNSVVK